MDLAQLQLALEAVRAGDLTYIIQEGKQMDYKELVCKCKQVTYEQIDDVLKTENDISDVVKVFEDVQQQTHCSTGCGGCHDKIMDFIADKLYER